MSDGLDPTVEVCLDDDHGSDVGAAVHRVADLVVPVDVQVLDPVLTSHESVVHGDPHAALDVELRREVEMTVLVEHRLRQEDVGERLIGSDRDGEIPAGLPPPLDLQEIVLGEDGETVELLVAPAAAVAEPDVGAVAVVVGLLDRSAGSLRQRHGHHAVARLPFGDRRPEVGREEAGRIGGHVTPRPLGIVAEVDVHPGARNGVPGHDGRGRVEHDVMDVGHEKGLRRDAVGRLHREPGQDVEPGVQPELVVSGIPLGGQHLGGPGEVRSVRSRRIVDRHGDRHTDLP